MKLRFSLRALLVITAALAILLAYSHRRRQWMVSQIEELRDEYVVVEAPNTFLDLVWQRPPERAYVWLLNPGTQERVEKLGVRHFEWHCQR